MEEIRRKDEEKKKPVDRKRHERKLFAKSKMDVQRPSNGRRKAYFFQIKLVNMVKRYVDALNLFLFNDRRKENQVSEGFHYAVYIMYVRIPF